MAKYEGSKWTTRTVKLNEEFNTALDTFVEVKGFVSASEAIRYLLGLGLQEAGRIEDGLLKACRDNAIGRAKETAMGLMTAAMEAFEETMSKGLSLQEIAAALNDDDDAPQGGKDTPKKRGRPKKVASMEADVLVPSADPEDEEDNDEDEPFLDDEEDDDGDWEPDPIPK